MQADWSGRKVRVGRKQGASTWRLSEVRFPLVDGFVGTGLGNGAIVAGGYGSKNVGDRVGEKKCCRDTHDECDT
jgi:hypothetical protein